MLRPTALLPITLALWNNCGAGIGPKKQLDKGSRHQGVTSKNAGME
jgi:hypothetical protein